MARFSSLNTDLSEVAALHIAGWRAHAAALIANHQKSIGFARAATGRRAAVALASAAHHRLAAAAYLRACRLHASGLSLRETLIAAGLASPFDTRRAA